MTRSVDARRHSEDVTPGNAPFLPSVADRAQRRAFEALLALPRAVRHRAAGQPHIVDGGALDPDITVGLKVLGRIGGKELDERSVADARHALAAESWLFAGELADVANVEDVVLDGSSYGAGDIPARLYRPHPSPVTVVGKHARVVDPDAGEVGTSEAGAEEAGAAVAARTDAPNVDNREPRADRLPLLVYFHGGGWVLGSHHTHDAVARALCAGGEVAVLNVDYRLAPEHVFPAAVDDAVAAFRWAHAHADALGIDPNRIAVGGDSAGGNLAAVVAQECARVGGPQPAWQMLFVPVTDLTLPRSRSYELFSEGYFLTRANMDWYEANYLGGGTLPDDVDAMRRDPRVSPLLADDLGQLAERGLAPAYVAVAGFDPLRDEGNAYARKLSDAGVATTLRVHTDAVHPFINILATDLGRRCMAEAIGALRMALHVR